MPHIAFQKSTPGHKVEKDWNEDWCEVTWTKHKGGLENTISKISKFIRIRKEGSNLRAQVYVIAVLKQTNQKTPQQRKTHNLESKLLWDAAAWSSWRTWSTTRCQSPWGVGWPQTSPGRECQPMLMYPLDLKCAGMTFMGTHMQWLLKSCTHLNGKGKCSSYYQTPKLWRWHKYC